jgi:hypothetical protein
MTGKVFEAGFPTGIPLEAWEGGEGECVGVRAHS